MAAPPLVFGKRNYLVSYGFGPGRRRVLLELVQHDDNSPDPVARRGGAERPMSYGSIESFDRGTMSKRDTHAVTPTFAPNAESIIGRGFPFCIGCRALE